MVGSYLLIHCAGQQEQQGDDLENTNQQGDLGQDDAGEGNGQENVVNNEGEGEGLEEETGEGANNALAQGGNLPPEGDLPPNSNVPLPANEPPPEQTPPLPANLPPENPLPPPEPVANVATTAPPPAPVADNSSTAPITGGRVRYAKSAGTQVVDAPGGSPVTTLEQGDHPVTWEESGWFKLGTGLYVSTDALSDKGIPRSSSGNPWQ